MWRCSAGCRWNVVRFSSLPETRRQAAPCAGPSPTLPARGRSAGGWDPAGRVEEGAGGRLLPRGVSSGRLGMVRRHYHAAAPSLRLRLTFPPTKSPSRDGMPETRCHVIERIGHQHPGRSCAGSMTMTSPISEFVWPRPALADCVTAMVIRDTRGCGLDQTQRFNFFPASPMPVVVCIFAGDSHVIEHPDQMDRPWTGARSAGRFTFAGAQPWPIVTWNPGEVYGVMIGFYPHAFSAMTGLDLSSFTGREVPAEEALPQPILEPCRNFFDAAPREGIERSFSVLQDKIEIMWAGMRPAGTRLQRLIADWSKSLVHRAAATGSGRSTRQIQRRVKLWTGFGERDLQVFGQVQQLHFKVREATRKGDVDWAALAAASGFADQAHMIRRMKQHTGFTPKQLYESSRYDEAFWYHRLYARIIDQYLGRPEGQ
jgi:AraC-like DNA-binding protein